MQLLKSTRNSTAAHTMLQEVFQTLENSLSSFEEEIANGRFRVASMVLCNMFDKVGRARVLLANVAFRDHDTEANKLVVLHKKTIEAQKLLFENIGI